MLWRNGEILDLAEEHSDQGENPVTARQVYYQAVVAGVVDKTENGYRKVLTSLSTQRESGELPWHWIADNARIRRQMSTFRDLGEALEEMQESYRRDYWRSQPNRVEVWVESDALATALQRVVLPYGVPLFTCRGQSSKTFIREAAVDAARIGKPIHVIYVGDWDPTGLAIDRSLEERYERYSDDAELTLTRVAVTAEQIHEHGLPAGPAKSKDPNFKRFASECTAEGLAVAAVEAEALEPALLREVVEHAIVELVDVEAWKATRNYEAAERDQLAALLGGGR